MTSVRDRTLLDWLSQHVGYPARRLPAQAELLLCFASAAALEETGATPSNAGPVVRRDTPRDVALRHHELRRARVHFKSDNSAKV